MRIPLLIAFIFISLAASAQLNKDITRALESRDLDTLDNYFITLRKDRRVIIKKDLRREIIPGYSEVFPEITEFKKVDSITRLNNNKYTLRLLVRDKKIFYYNFVQQSYYKDESAYAQFLEEFQKVYNTPLDTTDLFRTDIVYGEGCGDPGADPPYLRKMTVLVNKKDFTALRKWLRSANVEKQMYAARAYRCLDLQGYTPNQDERRLLSILADKKGFAYTCSGCIGSYRQISNMLNELKEIRQDMLTSDQ